MFNPLPPRPCVLSVDLCACRLPSWAPAGHRKWCASRSRPASTAGVNEFLSSFHLTPSAKGAVTKSDGGERWRKVKKGGDPSPPPLLAKKKKKKKKDCGKWLIAQDARQHEPFPTGLKMICEWAFRTNTHFSFSFHSPPPLRTHDLPPPYFIIPQIRQSLIEPQERHLISRSALFFFFFWDFFFFFFFFQ